MDRRIRYLFYRKFTFSISKHCEIMTFIYIGNYCIFKAVNYTLNKTDFWWEGISIVIFGSSFSDFFFFSKKERTPYLTYFWSKQISWKKHQLEKKFQGLLIQCKQNEPCSQDEEVWVKNSFFKYCKQNKLRKTMWLKLWTFRLKVW